MKVRIPKEYSTLSAGQKERIDEYCKNVAFKAAKEQNEKDGRIMLDLYIKMVCLALHDAFGFGEKRLNYFLATHSSLFRDQRKKVQNGTQLAYLDKRMSDIFKKNGFPQGLFDKMLGPVETEEASQV